MQDYQYFLAFWYTWENFVETMLKLFDEMAEFKVVNDQFGKFNYTVGLAHKITEITELDARIYPVTN